MQDDWLTWAKRLQAIAQSGLAFSENVFDRERYQQVRAISAEIVAQHTNEPRSKIDDLFSAESGYATPKTVVRAAVIDTVDNKPQLLMTRELAENSSWTLPGGFADIGDTPQEAVERETFEETGYRVKASKILALVNRNRLPETDPAWNDIWVALIRCELVGGSPKESIETGESRFFALDALPDDIAIRRTNRLFLPWIKAHVEDASLSAEFN